MSEAVELLMKPMRWRGGRVCPAHEELFNLARNIRSDSGHRYPYGAKELGDDVDEVAHHIRRIVDSCAS